MSRKTGVSSMTQLSFGPAPQLGASASSGIVSAASWLFSKILQPDVLVVLVICATGLILTLVAASTLPGFSSALSEASMVVGP
jgi:hypothetical protein